MMTDFLKRNVSPFVLGYQQGAGTTVDSNACSRTSKVNSAYPYLRKIQLERSKENKTKQPKFSK